MSAVSWPGESKPTRRKAMTLNDFRERLFPQQYRVLFASIYATTGILIYAMGISSIKMLPKLVIRINGSLSLIGIIAFAWYLFRNVGKLEGKLAGIWLTGHVFVAIGVLASVAQVIVSGSFNSLTNIPSGLLLLVGFLAIARLLTWMASRSKPEIDRLVNDRARSATQRFIFGPGQFVVLGMMRPKRRFMFFVSVFGLAAAVTIAAMVLYTDKHYIIAGVLFLFFFVAEAIIESTLYAEVVDRKSVEGELNAARVIQMGLMPKEDPVVKDFDISGLCVPANEVGGDFFDYVWLDERKTKLGIAVADVSGKALKAAMTAVMTSGMVYEEVANSDSPRQILRRINRPMYLKTDKQVFTAMAFAVFDVRRKLLRLSNAGQSQPMLLRGNELKYLTVKGGRLPLGLQERQNYEEATLRLRSGDVVLFYTDGLPEATNDKHELLGFEAVEEEFKKHAMSPARDIIQSMIGLVERHTGRTEQHDDTTVVVVKVL